MFGVASVTAFFAVVADFVWFVSLMAVYGVFKCGFILLRPVLVQDVVGPRKTPSALGMMFGFLGISNMASYPFTGKRQIKRLVETPDMESAIRVQFPS